MSLEQSPILEAREKALSHFLSLDNPFLDIQTFAKAQISLLVGDRVESDLTENKHMLVSGLEKLVEQLEPARRFNETYIGHMLSQPSIPGLFGTEIAQIINSNTVASEVSRVETKLEKEAIDFILQDIIGYKETEELKPSGTFTSGGTMANMAALTVARRLMPSRYPQLFREELRNGVKKEVFIQGGKRMKVFVIPQKHYSIPKAIDVLGGPNYQIELEYIATKDLRMSVADLEEKIDKAEKDGTPIMAIIGIAGETETGIVDPLNEIVKIAESHHIFSIADGAYGASYRLSRNGKLFEGLDRFDAVVWDPHKTGYIPYGAGFVGFKNVNHHIELGRDIDAPYIGIQAENSREEETDKLLKQFLDSGEERALGRKRFEGSMSAAPQLSILATKYTLGKDGLAIIYDITLDRIDHLYEKLKSSEFLSPFPDKDPDLNLLCFRLKPEIQYALRLTDNKKLIEFINKSRLWLDKNIERNGGYYLSNTELKLDNYDPENSETLLPVWRAVIMNPRTTDVILDEAVNVLEGYIKEKLLALSSAYQS